MARHIRIFGPGARKFGPTARKFGPTGRRTASVASALGTLVFGGALVFGAGLWLAPAANADELVQVALLDLSKLKALSDTELDEARGLGGEGPGVDASVSDQFAVILWDETKRSGTTNTGTSSGGITVSVTVVEN